MPEKFEVTLVANDQFTQSLDSATEKVKSLTAETMNAKDGLSNGLGGSEAQAGVSQLDKQFASMAVSAKKNVQLLGDMVPPLKTFGELSGKYLGTLGKVGIAGGAIYGVSRMASSMGEMANHAYDMDVSAKNIGVSAEKLSMLTGAFKLAGIEESPALQSLTSVSDTFNDILRGGESGNRIMSQLASMGLSRDMIPTRRDVYGNEMVIVDELLPVLDRLYDSINDAQTRHEFAKATGLDASMETLFRGDVSVQDRYNRAYEVGLVRLESTNASLTRLSIALTETSAAFSGFYESKKNSTVDFLMRDGSVEDGIKGIGDFLTIGDAASGAQAFGFNRGDDAKKWRVIRNDEDFDAFRETLGVFDSWKIGDFVGILPEGAWDSFLEFKRQSNPNFKDPFAPKPVQTSTGRSLEEDNIKRFLDLIAMSEGTYGRGDEGYNIAFGGRAFDNGLAAHPNIRQPFRQTDGAINYTTAAGRYQFTNGTWNRVAQQLGLTDFGKESQDRAAIELIRQRGALPDVLAGNHQSAVNKLGGEWASFPSSNYPQNTHSANTIDAYWNRLGAQNINAGGSAPLANEIAEAINQTPAQLNIRITNDNTQRTQTLIAQSGATVAVAMEDF